MFNKLYTPEWFKLINPYGLLDKLLTIFRVLLNPLTFLHKKLYPFNNRIQYQGYTTVEFYEDDILYVGDKLLAGSGSNTSLFVYRVTGILKNFEIIGCTYTERMAIKNMDYIIRDGIYWFKEHPSVFCHTLFKNNRVVYHTVAYSTDLIRVFQALKPTTDCSTSFQTADMYHILTTNGLHGALNTLYLNYQGIYVTDGVHGKFIYTWSEKDRIFGITDRSTLVSAPINSKTKINYIEPFKIDLTPDYFLVQLQDIYYPVSFTINDVKHYPNIQSYYPELKIYKENMFLGSDLYYILKNTGCNFTEITYIDKYIVDDNFINNSMHKGDILLYLGNLHITVVDSTIPEFEFSDTTNKLIKEISNMTVNIRYTF